MKSLGSRAISFTRSHSEAFADVGRSCWDAVLGRGTKEEFMKNVFRHIKFVMGVVLTVVLVVIGVVLQYTTPSAHRCAPRTRSAAPLHGC
jgi:hypothetical protein